MLGGASASAEYLHGEVDMPRSVDIVDLVIPPDQGDGGAGDGDASLSLLVQVQVQVHVV